MNCRKRKNTGDQTQIKGESGEQFNGRTSDGKNSNLGEVKGRGEILNNTELRKRTRLGWQLGGGGENEVLFRLVGGVSKCAPKRRNTKRRKGGFFCTPLSAAKNARQGGGGGGGGGGWEGGWRGLGPVAFPKAGYKRTGNGNEYDHEQKKRTRKEKSEDVSRNRGYRGTARTWKGESERMYTVASHQKKKTG